MRCKCLDVCDILAKIYCLDEHNCIYVGSTIESKRFHQSVLSMDKDPADGLEYNLLCEGG